MATHRDSPWLKRVLIPFWIVRIGMMGFLLVAYIYALVLAAGIDGDPLDSMIAAVIVLIALLAFCGLLELISILMFMLHSLKPVTFLIFNVLQTTIWTGMVALDLIGTFKTSNDDASHVYKRYGGWIVSIVLLAAFYGLLIYASVVYHRARMAKRRSVYGYAAGKGSVSYQFDKNHSFNAYRSPSPQSNPSFPSIASNSSTTVAARPDSRHIDLDSRRSMPPSREPTRKSAPRRPSPLSIAEALEPVSPTTPTIGTQEPGYFIDDHRVSRPFSFVETPPPLPTPPLPIAHVAAHARPATARTPPQQSENAGRNRKSEPALSRKSLNAYQEIMYALEQQARDSELPERP